MYRIGEFSRICGVSVKTLRFYAKEGIVIPEYVDNFTGYRYYSLKQLEQIHQVIALKSMGFSLQDIKKFEENIFNIMTKRERELQEILQKAKKQLLQLQTIREMMSMDTEKRFSIILQEVKERFILSKRAVFKNREELKQISRKMKQDLKKLGVEIEEPITIINYETSMPFSERADMEIGISPQGNFPKGLGYQKKWILGGEVASILCKSDEINQAYSALQFYIQHNNYQIIGAFYEIQYEEEKVEIKVPVWHLKDEAKEPENDNIQVKFENDEEVIGHWKVVDILPTKECFNPEKIKMSEGTGSIQIKDLYFLPNGEKYWCFSWTKGYLISRYGYPVLEALNPYEIWKKGGKTYLFLQMKGLEYFYRNGKPEIYVLEKINSERYQKEEIRKKEKTDLPFEADNRVIGKWNVCDFVESIEAFSPENQKWKNKECFFQKIYFEPNGRCELVYLDGKYQFPDCSWTKGKLLVHMSKVTEGYKIKKIDGQEYLFVEWKTGDYTFGGQEPKWYVFQREFLL